MIGRVLAVAALTSVVLGFSNTSPVILWSSTSSITLDSLPSRLQDDTHTLAVVHGLVDSESICDYDAVVVVEQPGLHAFDLRSLSTQSGLFTRLNSSPSARQYPYVNSHPDFNALTAARMISSKCQSQLSQITPDNIPTSFEHHSPGKHVLAIVMPDLSEPGKVRKDVMAAHESLLSQELDALADQFTNHLVIFTGSLPSLSGFVKRQGPVPSTNNASLPSTGTGILSKYQLLTPELITSLLIFFFIILPIVFFGIKALASIQNTITTRSSFNALEKKNQ